MGLTFGSKRLCRSITRFFLVALLVLGFPVLSSAAHKPRKFHYDLFAEGGGSLYQGEMNTATSSTILTSTGITTFTFVASQTVEDSGRLFVGGDFWLTRHDAIQASYSYAPADLPSTVTIVIYPPGSSQPSTNVTSSTGSLGGHFLSFDYLRSFTLSRNWSLLLAAGVGAVWWHSRSFTPRHFSANLGVGLSYRLTRHWAVRAEYRDYMEEFPPSGGAMLHDHAPTVGLVYRF